MSSNIIAAKYLFRSRSTSFLSYYARGITSSKSGTSDSESPRIPQESDWPPIVKLKYTRVKKFDGNEIFSNISRWLLKSIQLSWAIGDYHEGNMGKARDLTSSLGAEEITKLALEKEKQAYRERWATYRLLHKYEDVARRLIDDNVDNICQVFYLVDHCDIWVLDVLLEESNYDQCWMSLLNNSKVPLADKLRDELKARGISPQTFSLSMKKVYAELRLKNRFLDYWLAEIVDYGPDDIVTVLNQLPICQTDYECIRLLFNLEESEKWQIKDEYKRINMCNSQESR